MTAENLAWFAVCMRFVIAYGCERSIEDGVRLRESDALFRAIRGRLLFIPLCMVWPSGATPFSGRTPTIRDRAARQQAATSVLWRSALTLLQHASTTRCGITATRRTAGCGTRS